MKHFKNFDNAQKPTVKAFVNSLLTGANYAVNSKVAEAFYYYILLDGTNYENANGTYIYYQTTSGKGRFTSAFKNNLHEYTDFFTAVGVIYTTGNNAPKGGKNGDYLHISKEERIRLTDLYTVFLNS